MSMERRLCYTYAASLKHVAGLRTFLQLPPVVAQRFYQLNGEIDPTKVKHIAQVTNLRSVEPVKWNDPGFLLRPLFVQVIEQLWRNDIQMV
jgi:hypothetical protein